jgi:cytochrome c oxidase assembly protein Cox11
MKLKPKTEFRILAAVLLAVAVSMLTVTFAMLPVYHTFAHLPWQRTFREQSDQRVFLLVFRELFFIAFPGVVALNGWVAWKILQHAQKLPISA